MLIKKPLFKKLLFGKSLHAPFLGLDISRSRVKLIQLSLAGNRFRVERYVIAPFPKSVINDGGTDNPEMVASVLREAWLRMNTPIRNVAIALPTTMAVYKKILVSSSQMKNLESFIEAEASQMIPFPLSEVNIDYQILGPSPSSPEDIGVFLCGARKEKVEECVGIVEMAGLKVQLVDVEAFAIMTALEQIEKQLPVTDKERTFAVFHLGATQLRCNIIRNANLLYHREQEIGGQLLTREIQQHYKMTFADAEEAKCNGKLPESYERELLMPFIETLGQEIQRSLQFFYTTVSLSQYQSVDYIVLVGGGSLLPGLDDTVARRTQIEVLIGNPFKLMDVSQNVALQNFSDDRPSLMVACGLALRGGDK